MSELVHFGGVDGATGQPLHPTVPLEELADQLADEFWGLPKELRKYLRKLHEQKSDDKLGLKEGYDAQKIEEAGWGVIWGPNTPQQVKDNLDKLIEHRTPSGKAPREYTYAGEEAYDFRKSEGQGYGAVDPEKMPYYLLIVGDPTKVPFDFQHDLDAQHAVGRLYFQVPGDYARYADHVVRYEKADQSDRQRRVGIFSPTSDPLTKQNSELLAKTLAEKYDGKDLETVEGNSVKYRSEHRDGEGAKRDDLRDLLEREAHRPCLLFAAAHGLGFSDGQPEQRQAKQGAILGHEYPGAEAWKGGPVPDSMYLAGEHIAQDLDLRGLLFFAVACYSTGTRRREGSEPFLAFLPQRLLAQGALAFIGHVGQAWTYSYGWPGVGPLTTTYESTLEAILKGKRVGDAFEYFNQHYLDLNNELTRKKGLVTKLYDEEPVAEELVRLGLACKDARQYLLFGDPAVCLRPEILSAAGE